MNIETDICENCKKPIHPGFPCEEMNLVENNDVDKTYLDLLESILRYGKKKSNRTGVNTLSIFGSQARYKVDLFAFPILTTKRVWFKGIVHELLWFIKGDTNIKYLVDNDVHIWDAWAYVKYVNEVEKHGVINKQTNKPYTQDEFIALIKNDDNFAKLWGDLGEGIYGSMWRNFPHYIKVDKSPSNTQGLETVYEYHGVDQLQKIVDKLKTKPDDRRIIVSAWHPYLADTCALPPCHCLFHFNTEELTLQERYEYATTIGLPLAIVVKDNKIDGDQCNKILEKYNIPKYRLNLLLYQRSCDAFLGVPFNISSYSLLLAMVSQCVNMIPGEFIHTYGDLHIYDNHIEQVKQQLTRHSFKLPKLWLNPNKINLFDFKYDDVKLIDYKHHPTIKAPVAI